MKILNVHTQYFEGHIILKDFGSVAAALNACAADDKISLAFAARLMNQIQQQLATEYAFRRDCGYLGAGVFKDAVIEVLRTDSFTAPYLLRLSSAADGSQAEVKIAQSMGAELGLHKIEVQIELAPEGNQFEFDFKVIFDYLRREAKTLHPEAMAKGLMSINGTLGRTGRPGNLFLPGYPAQVFLRIDKNSVGPFYDYSDTQPAWTRDGTIIRGPLLQSLEESGKLYNPRLVITVTASDKSRATTRHARAPIANPRFKSRLRQVAEGIENTFPDSVVTNPTKAITSM